MSDSPDKRWVGGKKKTETRRVFSKKSGDKKKGGVRGVSV